MIAKKNSIKIFPISSYLKGQTAVEYLLLLSTVVVIVLIGFHTYLPRVRIAAEGYLNTVSNGILGAPSLCGDGIANAYEQLYNTCCQDTGCL